MTANTLYEAVEPRIVWKQLLEAVTAEITGNGTHYEVSLTASPVQSLILKSNRHCVWLVSSLELSMFRMMRYKMSTYRWSVPLSWKFSR